MAARGFSGWVTAWAIGAALVLTGLPGAPGPFGVADAQAAGKGHGKGGGVGLEQQGRGGAKAERKGGFVRVDENRGLRGGDGDWRLERSRRPGDRAGVRDDDDQTGRRGGDRLFGRRDGEENPGQGELRSEMRGLNAARGGDMKFMHANPDSQVGRLETYRQAAELGGGDADRLLDEAAGGPVTHRVQDEVDDLLGVEPSQSGN